MRCRSTAILLVLLVGPAWAAAPSADPDGPALSLPEGALKALPPDAQHSQAPPHATVPDPVSDPDTAMRTMAALRTQRLNALYDRLAEAKDEHEADAIGTSIEAILLRSGSDTADLLMARAMTAMNSRDFGTASAILDKVITLQPGWAEAWNKRATVRYLDNDDVGSMADIGHVLALEPRHFGALSGMGLILHRNGDEKAALTVLRRATAIDPQDHHIKSLVEELTPVVEGHDL